jgi:hypothetical protein
MADLEWGPPAGEFTNPVLGGPEAKVQTIRTLISTLTVNGVPLADVLERASINLKYFCELQGEDVMPAAVLRALAGKVDSDD